MAKFCIHCGRKLNEGEVCTCQANVQNDNIGNNLSDIIKGMFVKPIDTIKKYTNEKYFNLSLILIVILSISSALWMTSFYKNLSTALSGIMMYLYGMNDISYLETFFIALIEFIILSFGYCGLLYFVNSVIFKGEKNYKKIVSMFGVTSVIQTAGLLITTILMFVNLFLGIMAFSLITTLNMLYIYKGIKELGVSDENKHGYIFFLTEALLLIIIFILLFLIS